MIDCNSNLVKFHNSHIRLSENDQNDLRNKRKNNQERLIRGLAKNSNPSVTRFMKQGSYAMKTITQHPNTAYDIDDGAVFKKDDLKNSQGGYKSSIDVRNMVLNAFGKDKRFRTDPELRPNCIRVNYKEGYHVDIPVYRTSIVNGEEVLELASTSWLESYPEKVTKWFNEVVKKKSPESGNKSKQMRRITRYIKYWANSVKSWNMPSGFILTVLVSECYDVCEDRDDESLFKTLKSIKSRLETNKTLVLHPILHTNLAKGKEAKMNTLLDKLNNALSSILNVLENDMCTETQAFKAWKKFFHNHKDFKTDSNEFAESALFLNEPEKPADIGGQHIYARKRD